VNGDRVGAVLLLSIGASTSYGRAHSPTTSSRQALPALGPAARDQGRRAVCRVRVVRLVDASSTARQRGPADQPGGRSFRRSGDRRHRGHRQHPKTASGSAARLSRWSHHGWSSTRIRTARSPSAACRPATIAVIINGQLGTPWTSTSGWYSPPPLTRACRSNSSAST
jgi:hypothetical protein